MKLLTQKPHKQIIQQGSEKLQTRKKDPFRSHNQENNLRNIKHPMNHINGKESMTATLKLQDT